MSKLGPHVDELGDDAQSRLIREDAMRTSDAVTKLVSLLATSHDLGGPPIRDLMQYVFCLIGSRTTPATVSPRVETPTSVCLGDEDGNPVQMVIMFPVGWSGMALADPFMAMGALVFCGSQCADYFNDRLIGQTEEVKRRAQIYESEYLHALGDRLKPNPYQQDTMALYPRGFGNHHELLYERREAPTPLERGAAREEA